MRKGRLPKGSSAQGQSKGGEIRETCTCSNGTFVSHVCRVCQELICVNCRSKEHTHHKSDRVTVVAGELRNDIGGNVSNQTNSDVLDSIQKSKQMMATMIKELITIERNEISKIDKRINEFHKELDEIRMKHVNRINTIVRVDIDNLKKEERILDKTALSIKSMLDDAKNMLKNANDIDIVKGGYSMCDSLNDISKTDITTPNKGRTFSVQFVPWKSDKQELENMFGEVIVEEGGAVAGIGHRQHKIPTQVDVAKNLSQTRKESGSKMPVQLKVEKAGTKVSMVQRVGLEFVTSVSVSGGDGGIQGVCVTADDKCWFTDCFSPDIKLVDLTGTRHRTVTVCGGCTGITTDGRSMYVACYYDRSIKKISTDHKVTDVQTSLSFPPPLGLTCVPVTGELLVCGETAGVFSVTDSGVRRTLTGVKFQCACDVAVSNNGDICVTDRNKVFIFNSDKRHVGTYDGHGTSIQNTIVPCGVTCDSRGNFIVVDRNNHVIHIITRDGDNVSIYDTTKDCEEQPWWIDISPSGRLWVSFVGSTIICVYDMI